MKRRCPSVPFSASLDGASGVLAWSSQTRRDGSRSRGALSSPVLVVPPKPSRVAILATRKASALPGRPGTERRHRLIAPHGRLPPSSPANSRPRPRSVHHAPLVFPRATTLSKRSQEVCPVLPLTARNVCPLPGRGKAPSLTHCAFRTVPVFLASDQELRGPQHIDVAAQVALWPGFSGLRVKCATGPANCHGTHHLVGSGNQTEPRKNGAERRHGSISQSRPSFEIPECHSCGKICTTEAPLPE